MIGIIGAMDDEIEVYKSSLVGTRETKWGEFTFYEGSLENKDVVLVKSGVGKVFSAMICQKLIQDYNPSKIIFTGVGGSLNDSLEIGDVVVGEDSVHHDFNATQLGFLRGQISYTDYRFFEADKELVKLALTTSLENNKLIKGRILTGDQFMSKREKDEHKYLKEEFNGDCIEMEGAAVAQVCVVNNIPHLVVRTISDKADGSAVADYNKFFPLVAKNSFMIVKHILKQL